MQVASRAIIASPFVGYGSWARNRVYATEYLRELDAYLHYRYFRSPDNMSLIPSHSALLQAWVEAGILGVGFFGYFIFKLVKAIIRLTFYDELGSLTPLLGFFFVDSLWNSLLSPFSGTSRLPIAIAAAMIYALDQRAVARL
jgi:O-antigen ligase